MIKTVDDSLSCWTIVPLCAILCVLCGVFGAQLPCLLFNHDSLFEFMFLFFIFSGIYDPFSLFGL